MKRLLPRVLPSLFLLAALGCGSKKSADDPGDAGPAASAGPVAKDQYATAASGALCDNVAPCCMTSGYPFKLEGCKAALGGQLAARAQTSGLGYDADAAGRCVALLQQVAVACKGTADELKQLDDACNAVFKGTRNAGDPCTSSQQCAPAAAPSTAYCDPAMSVCAVSVAQTHRKMGESCNGSCLSSDASTGGSTACTIVLTPPPAKDAGVSESSICFQSDGLRCDSSTGTCGPLAATGAACASDLDCAAAAYCGAAKVCAARGSAGSACASSSACDAMSYCDASAMTCKARKSVGDGCGSNDECLLSSCKKSKCADPSVIADPILCGGS